MKKMEQKNISKKELENVNGGGCPQYAIPGGELITTINNSCGGYEYWTTSGKEDSHKCKTCNYFFATAIGFGQCSLRTKDDDPYK